MGKVAQASVHRSPGGSLHAGPQPFQVGGVEEQAELRLRRGPVGVGYQQIVPVVGIRQDAPAPGVTRGAVGDAEPEQIGRARHVPRIGELDLQGGDAAPADLALQFLAGIVARGLIHDHAGRAVDDGAHGDRG